MTAIDDLQYALSGQSIRKVYDSLPDAIDLVIADMPICLEVEGRRYLLLNEENAKNARRRYLLLNEENAKNAKELPPSQEYLDRVFNIQSEHCRADLEDMAAKLFKLSDCKLNRASIEREIASLSHKLREYACNNLPYAE